MRKFLMGALAVLMLAPAMWAQEKEPADQEPAKPEAAKEETAKEEPLSPAQQFSKLVLEQRAAMNAFMAKYREAKTNEERQQLMRESYPQPATYAAQFLQLAEQNPDDPIAVQALGWILSNASGTPEGEKAVQKLLAVAAANKEDQAVFDALASFVSRGQGELVDKVSRFLVENHIDNEKLGMVCLRMMYSRSPQAQATLREVIDKTSNQTVKGEATYALAKMMLRSGPETNKEAEELLESVVTNYADIDLGRRTLGQMAEGDLFELRNLQIGMNAPEIEGEDIDGQTFKLSDYKGKVLVLDFWGDW